jgi:hypothetical protein
MWNRTFAAELPPRARGEVMTAPVYYVVFHDGHWRIRYEEFHLGEFLTSAAAAHAALQIARSRLTAHPSVGIFTLGDGTITIREPE